MIMIEILAIHKFSQIFDLDKHYEKILWDNREAKRIAPEEEQRNEENLLTTQADEINDNEKFENLFQ
jgi:hypothetical protein